MHQLQTFRIDEDLRPGLVPLFTTYSFQAPDRMSYQISTGSELVWIGTTRYLRDGPDQVWRVQETGFSLPVPRFSWDVWGSARLLAPRLLGASQVENIDTQVLSFFMEVAQAPIWFRLWVDAEGLVRRAEMRAQGHFMDHRYYDLDESFTIESPV